MVRLPKADRWVLVCTAAGQYRVAARTGKRGAPVHVGIFPTVEEAAAAAEAAIQAGPVEKARRGGKMPPKPQKPAPAVREQVEAIIEEPPDYPWL